MESHPEYLNKVELIYALIFLLEQCICSRSTGNLIIDKQNE